MAQKYGWYYREARKYRYPIRGTFFGCCASAITPTASSTTASGLMTPQPASLRVQTPQLPHSAITFEFVSVNLSDSAFVLSQTNGSGCGYRVTGSDAVFGNFL
jgi:hypothetical protein